MNMPNRRIAHCWRAALLALPLFAARCAAQSDGPAPATDDTATSGPAANITANDYGFSLAAPDLYEIEGGAEHLTVGDFNGDDLPDFVCVNNDKNLFYFFYQKAKGPRRFERVAEPAETVVSSLAAGDFNNDGRADLAIGGTQSFVRYQRDGGDAGNGLADARELEEAGQTLLARDFDGDGFTDLLLVRDGQCFMLRQGANGAFERPARMGQAYPVAGDPLCFDVNNDGLPDLAWRDADAGDIMVVRRQVAPGVFDAETGYRAGFFADMFGSPDLGGGGAGFAGVEEKTLTLQALRFGPDPNLVPGEPIFGRIRLLPMLNDKAPGRETFHLTAAPLEGGTAARPALFVLAEGQPSLEVIGCDAKGRVVRRTEPSLQGARKLRVSAGPDGAPQWLWLLSTDEQTIGAARIHPAAPGADGAAGKPAGFDFPQMLDLGAKPLAFDVADMDTSAGLDLVFASAPEGGGAEITLVSGANPAALDLKGATKYALAALDAAYFKDVEIAEIVAADVNRDRKTDLMLFTKYDELKLLVQKPEGGFAPVAQAGSGVQQGLFKGLKPGQVWVGDLDGDGFNELLIAHERYARLVRLAPDGKIEIVRQFNGKSAGSQIAAVAAANVAGDGKPEILLLDRGAEHLVTIYQQQAGKDYEVLRNVETDPLAGDSMLTADLDGDSFADIVVGSEDKLGVIFPNRNDAVPQTLVTLRSEVEDGGYRIVAGADLIDAPGDEIVALENKEHLLEFYRLNDKKLERFYKFKVFGGEGVAGFRAPEAKGPPEPSEIVFADFDVDKRQDMAVLVHEKAVVYMRQDAKKKNSQ